MPVFDPEPAFDYRQVARGGVEQGSPPMHLKFLIATVLALNVVGCVNTTMHQHLDGSWSVIVRNPALIDANVVMTTRYAAGDEPLVMLGPPVVALGPSTLSQFLGPVAYVIGKREEKKGRQDGGNTTNIDVAGSRANAAADAVGGAGGAGGQADVNIENFVEIDIDNDGGGGNDWPDWPDDDD